MHDNGLRYAIHRYSLFLAVTLLLIIQFIPTTTPGEDESSDALLPDPVWTSAVSDRSYSVAWGDYDRDGDLDLAVGNNGPNHVYENLNGTLSTGPVWESQDDADTTVTQEIMWGDINGDQWPDLVAVNGAWGSGYDVVYLNSDGNISTTADWRNDNSDQSNGMDLGDYDGDGDLDLVTSNYNGRECLYENQDGTLTTNPVWQSYLFDDGTMDAVFFDVDGDDDLDLFFACSGTTDSKDSNANRLYLNEPQLEGGRYAQLPDWTSSDEYWTTCARTADMDNDGDMDIIASNGYGSDHYTVMYENTGTGLDRDFAWSIGGASWPYGCDVGDVDSDGWEDVVISCQGDYVYMVKNNEGTLANSFFWNSSDAVKTYYCALGDMDGDGLPDLAVANYETANTPGNNTIYAHRAPPAPPEPGRARPWVTVEFPGNHSRVEGNVTISGKAGHPENETVSLVEIMIRGDINWTAADGTEDWEFYWENHRLMPGSYEISVRSKSGKVYSNVTTIAVILKETAGNTQGNGNDDIFHDLPGYECAALLGCLAAAAAGRIRVMGAVGRNVSRSIAHNIELEPKWKDGTDE